MMQRSLVLAGLAVSALTAMSGALASDSLILSCPICHGASTSLTPSLHGRSAAEFETLLRAYRDGSRKGTAMPRLSAAMTDAEIQRLAKFYAESRP